METQYIIEKFTRCPGCGSFSLKGEDDQGKNYRCANCSDRFLFKDDQLKALPGNREKEKPLPVVSTPQPPLPGTPVLEEIYRADRESTEPPQTDAVENNILVKKSKKTKKVNKMVLISGAAAAVAIIAIIAWLFLASGPAPDDNRDDLPVLTEREINNSNSSSPSPTSGNTSNEKQNFDVPTSSQPIEAIHPPITTPPIDVPLANESTTSSKTEPTTRENKNTQPSGTSEKINQEPGEKSKAFKIASSTIIKIRSRFPDKSAPQYRWYFQRTSIRISRSDSQRVYIAGDNSGTMKWAVDDVIIINNKVITGCTEPMSDTGEIPNSRKLPPYDITDLVRPNRSITLNIKFADYGILWGNTDVYIVVR